MQPTSALANKKIPLKVNKKAAKVTAGQSKDIMDGILDELDDQDIDDLQEVNHTKIGANQGGYQDDTQMAFNKEEELDMKYNVKTSSSGAAQKRNISEISKKVNPFAKKNNQVSEINSSAFESALDKTINEKEINQEEINAVS